MYSNSFHCITGMRVSCCISCRLYHRGSIAFKGISSTQYCSSIYRIRWYCQSRIGMFLWRRWSIGSICIWCRWILLSIRRSWGRRNCKACIFGWLRRGSIWECRIWCRLLLRCIWDIRQGYQYRCGMILLSNSTHRKDILCILIQRSIHRMLWVDRCSERTDHYRDRG